MKKKILTMALICIASAFFACNGNRPAENGSDTANSVPDSIPSNIDTSKTTSASGDAGNIDNSASGGTKVAKPDSTKKK